MLELDRVGRMIAGRVGFDIEPIRCGGSVELDMYSKPPTIDFVVIRADGEVKRAVSVVKLLAVRFNYSDIMKNRSN